MKKLHFKKKKTYIFSVLLVLISVFSFVNFSFVQAADTTSTPTTTTTINAEDTIFASDLLTITPTYFDKYAIDTGAYDKLNVRPYGTYLSSITNQGGTVYNDSIIYQTRLEYKLYMNIYTSAMMSDVFSYYKDNVEDTYLTMYTRDNAWFNWIEHTYNYSYDTLVYSIKNRYNYDGVIKCNAKMNENFMTYNDEIITNMDFDIMKISAGNFNNGIIGEYDNIYNFNTYSSGFGAASYDSAQTLKDSSAAVDDVKNWLTNKENVNIETSELTNETVQNSYSTPLTPTEDVPIAKGQSTSSSDFQFRVKIRPEITYMKRYIYVREGTLYVDTKNDWFTFGVIYPTQSKDQPEQIQNLALFTQNQFVSQEFTIIVYAKATVPKSYFTENKIDFQDPTILAGDWIWSSSLYSQGGTVSLTSDSTQEIILAIIIGVVVIVLLIYFAPQIAMYNAGKKVGSASRGLPIKKDKSFVEKFGDFIDSIKKNFSNTSNG